MQNKMDEWILHTQRYTSFHYRVISNKICPARGSTLNQINGSAARMAQTNNINMRRVIVAMPAANQYVQHGAGTIAH
jgi:hypothetical protein